MEKGGGRPAERCTARARTLLYSVFFGRLSFTMGAQSMLEGISAFTNHIFSEYPFTDL